MNRILSRSTLGARRRIAEHVYARRGRSLLEPLNVGLILCTGLMLRLLLLPLEAGADLRNNIVLAGLSLSGRDVYALTHAFLHAHHLMPWTYFPLYLDLYAALVRLGAHTGWPIQILAKLPNVAADLAIGLLIYRGLRRRGHGVRAAAIGMSLYALNPLVLYNSAYYGRFDAIALALLFLALERYRSGAFVPAYALAIAVKTFPLFLLPLLLLGRDRQSPRRLAVVGSVVLALSLPAIVIDPGGLLSQLLSNPTGHIHSTGLGRLSWYSILWHTHAMSMDHILVLARIALLLFPVALLGVVHRPLYVKAAVCFTLFLVVNRTVYEQYLTWPLPFLIVVGLHYRSRLALWLVGLYSLAGMAENEATWTRHGYLPWTLMPRPWLALNAILVASGLLFIVSQMWPRHGWRPWATSRWRLARLASAYPSLLCVLCAGLVLRALLVPLAHPGDFAQWAADARATMAGVNIYTHSPRVEMYYQYAYFPLFLYLELPFMWLAQHTDLSFTVLGKLPVMGGDLLATLLIAALLRRRGHGDNVMALGAALYALNPLVLYNGAFYGRFDALCVGLFLLALCVVTAARANTWVFALLFALAVAAKTYPVFILPWLLVRRPVPRLAVLGGLGVVLGGLSLPYLIDDPARFAYDIVFYIGHRLPSGHTWQHILWASHYFDASSMRLLSYALLGVFVVALAVTTRLDLMTYSGVAVLLFLLLSKVVYEQYFLWVMPFLIIAALDRRSWLAGGILIALSGLGALSNEHVRLLLPYEHAVDALIAVAMAVYACARIVGVAYVVAPVVGTTQGRAADPVQTGPSREPCEVAPARLLPGS